VTQSINGQPASVAKPKTAADLLRSDSSDSIASHIDRVITSTTTSSAGKDAARKRSVQPTAAVPTSSTLTQSASSNGASDESTTPLPMRAKSDPQPSAKTGSASSSAQLTTRQIVKPMFIREGGSIPTIRLLEKEFSAPAANLPCGQASDNAHLDNERMRVENLYKSREIFRYVFANLVHKA
jgi:di- and tripeptidase